MRQTFSSNCELSPSGEHILDSGVSGLAGNRLFKCVYCEYTELDD